MRGRAPMFEAAMFEAAMFGAAMFEAAVFEATMFGAASVMRAPTSSTAPATSRHHFRRLAWGVSGWSDGGRTGCPTGGRDRRFRAVSHNVMILVRHWWPPL